jgi:hypothetical protein
MAAARLRIEASASTSRVSSWVAELGFGLVECGEAVRGNFAELIGLAVEFGNRFLDEAAQHLDLALARLAEFVQRLKPLTMS